MTEPNPAPTDTASPTESDQQDRPSPTSMPARRPTRGKGEPKDFSRMGLSHDRPEKPRYGAWAPSEGKPSMPILAALRAEGFGAQVGARRTPAGNFEVQYLAADADRVRDIILGIDPGATSLSVGR